jgi:hypothetical protein
MTYYGRRPAIINKYFYGRAQPYGCFRPWTGPAAAPGAGGGGELHSLNKPMHDTRHILGILSGLWTTTRLQWQLRRSGDMVFWFGGWFRSSFFL